MRMVKYGLPARQIAFALVLTFLLGMGNVALVVLTPEGSAGLVGVIAASGFYLWLLIRHASGLGNAVIEEESLVIEPTRLSLCGVRSPLRIGWGHLESANLISFGNGHQPFLMLRRSSRPKLLRLSVRSDGDRIVLDDILEKAVAWRSEHPEVPPLRQDDFFAGPVWKILAAVLIGAFVFAVIAIFQSGRAHEWSTWLRLVALSGLIFPFLRRILRPTGMMP